MTNLDARATAAATALTTIDAPHPPPGAVVALSIGDSSGAAAVGITDLATGERMTRATVHDLASVSKLLTTTALLRLVDAGAISLDTTVGELLGDGPIADRTVRQLLEHRGGLAPWWPLYLDPAAADDPIGAVLARASEAAADTARVYSDLGFLVLGALVARAGGAPFADVVRREVLGPLGLTGVTPGPTTEAAHAAASADGDAIERSMVEDGVPYPVPFGVEGFAWRTETLRGAVNDGNAFHAVGGPAGHAGWFATVDDMLTLGRALAADPGEHGLWSRATRDRFLAVSADPAQALGFRCYPAGVIHPTRTLWGHPGFTGTALAFAPADEVYEPLALALAANRLHGRPAPTRDRLAPTELLLSAATRAAVDPSEMTP